MLLLFCFSKQPTQLSSDYTFWLAFYEWRFPCQFSFQSSLVLPIHVPLRVAIYVVVQFTKPLLCFLGSVPHMHSLWVSSWFMLGHTQNQGILISRSLFFRIPLPNLQALTGYFSWFLWLERCVFFWVFRSLHHPMSQCRERTVWSRAKRKKKRNSTKQKWVFPLYS